MEFCVLMYRGFLIYWDFMDSLSQSYRQDPQNATRVCQMEKFPDISSTTQGVHWTYIERSEIREENYLDIIN